ncbi:MAG TPA: hypothetical protein VMT11_17170 [Myxococcaceae bacterium]|nr:hypothetical protein [Myxococcaceae bacterium]
MSDLDQRWNRLVDAARHAPAPASAPVSAGWVERVARRGIAARSADHPRAPETLAWGGLTVFAAAALAGVLFWPGPIATATDALGARIASLPREVPHAPRLLPAPLPPRPALPPARSALAAVTRWPELMSDFPFTSRRTDTP